MTADVRGSYLLDSAIARRWESAGLDSVFEMFWPADKRGRFESLNDHEARPETPFPYCIYDRTEVFSGRNHSAGEASAVEEIMYEDIPIEFHIHTKPAGTRDGRAVAVELLCIVQAAFDPGAELFDLSPDRHECTIAMGDWFEREGDQEWMGVLAYTVRMESTYNRVTG